MGRAGGCRPHGKKHVGRWRGGGWGACGSLTAAHRVGRVPRLLALRGAQVLRVARRRHRRPPPRLYLLASAQGHARAGGATQPAATTRRRSAQRCHAGRRALEHIGAASSPHAGAAPVAGVAAARSPLAAVAAVAGAPVWSLIQAQRLGLISSLPVRRCGITAAADGRATPLGVSLRLHPRRSRDPRAAPPRPAALHHGRFGHPRRAPRLGVRLVLRQASAAATPFTGAPLRCHATLPSRARAATVPQFAGIGYGNAPHRSKSTGGGLASRATHTAAAGAKPTAAIVSPLYAHARLRASPSVPCIPRPTPVPALPSPSYHVLHELMRVVCDAEGARCVARTSYRGAPRFALVGGLATTATLFLQSGAQMLVSKPGLGLPLDLQFKVLAGMLLLLFLGCAAGASYKRAAVAFGWDCACCAGWSSDSRITRWPAASLPHADGHYLQNQAADHPVVAPGRSDASSGLRG
mmetsp:Transcript_24882/g.80366  ORF Transcript_24882/g.80366 Transcript_24882/m.80366 type:complete len:466 (+) Transcript_24882:1156-2553(+)